ncbi:hypothetical protein TNCV_2965371 [Trichonephila clavipes]|nr:hypothetical protein TNCV_2965371 [Trichonephila clavipes]
MAAYGSSFNPTSLDHEVNLGKSIQTIGTAVRKVDGGYSRKTTAVDDRYIILQAKKIRYHPTSAIAQQLCTSISRKCRGLLGQTPSQRWSIRPSSRELHPFESWPTSATFRVL